MRKGVLFLILVGLISGLLSGCFAAKASTPLSVFNDVRPGMSQAQVMEKVDHDYASDACYIVPCKSISTTRYEPSSDVNTDYFMWVFMPLFSEAQATIVGFHDSTVIVVSRIDYDEAAALISMYGSHTYW